MSGVPTSLSPFDMRMESGGSGIQELMPYFPPAPPPKTGYHRYVFVLLAPKAIDELQGHLKKPKDRPHWGYGNVGAGVREWAEENHLVAIGKLRYRYSLILSISLSSLNIVP